MENYIKEAIQNPTGSPKIYTYRLRLDVYEDTHEPNNAFKEPSSRFAIDTLSITDNKDAVNSALKLNFEKLLDIFNAEVYGNKRATEMKVNDRVLVKDNQGTKWLETIININDYREPSMRYCVDLDDYAEEYIFVGDDNIELAED